MKLAVITGAADGIGKALAQCCAAASYRIIGIDRDAARAARTQAELEQTGAHCTFLLADLADPAEIERVLAELADEGRIDLCVHNAGINAVGHFARSHLPQQQGVLDVNLQAPMLLTAGLLQQASLGPGSTLVFLSSLSHFVGYPGAAVYAASKDGLASYARSLAVELAGRDIHVLTVYPGPTRTAHARRYSPDNRREQRRLAPELVAAQILQAVQQRRRSLIPGAGSRVFALLGHYAPGLTHRLMRTALLDKLESMEPTESIETKEA